MFQLLCSAVSKPSIKHIFIACLLEFGVKTQPDSSCSCTQELRDSNVLKFDDDDQARRKDDHHKARKRFVPSGGLAGFRVASDLVKMDFGAEEEPEED